MNENREMNSIHVKGTPEYRRTVFVSRGRSCCALQLTERTSMYFDTLEQMDDLILALQEGRISLAVQIEASPVQINNLVEVTQ